MLAPVHLWTVMRGGIMNEDTLPVGAYSIEDFARLHSIGRSTAYSEISAGRLVARKMRSRTIVTAEDAKAWRANLPKLAPAAVA
jgi:hypothetical protein